VSDAAGGACSSLQIGPARGGFAGAPSGRSWQVRFVGVAAPPAVTVNGRALAKGAWRYDSASRTLTVTTTKLPTRSATAIGTAAPLRLRVRAPHGRRIVRVDAFVATRRVRGKLRYTRALRARGRRIRSVTLRSLPTVPFRVRLVARIAGGRRIATVRRFGPCGVR
jgi:hypothetical protein